MPPSSLEDLSASTEVFLTALPCRACCRRRVATAVIQGTEEDLRFASNPLVTGVPFIRFYAGAPLTYLRDVRLGAFCLLDTEPRGFSPQEQAELAALADEVVVAIIQHEFDHALGKADG